ERRLARPVLHAGRLPADNLRAAGGTASFLRLRQVSARADKNKDGPRHRDATRPTHCAPPHVLKSLCALCRAQPRRASMLEVGRRRTGEDLGPLQHYRLIWRASVLMAALAVSSVAVAEQRLALIVTNQAYTQAGAQLTNTHRDGELVKAALEKVG